MSEEPDERTDAVARQVVGAAIRVHRELGPGLLESVYQRSLEREFVLRRLPFTAQLIVPIFYRGESLDADLRLDILVDDRVIVEVKAVAALAPIHTAQVLTYLKLTKLRVGFLLNFNAILMKDGIRRVIRS